jgi:hypothetical protein
VEGLCVDGSILGCRKVGEVGQSRPLSAASEVHADSWKCGVVVRNVSEKESRCAICMLIDCVV